jgi:putative aldouronate transport system substrate-binding protein
MLTFLNRLYTEGLIDPDLFSQARGQVFAKGRDGLIGAVSTGDPATQFRMPVDQYALMPPLEGPDGTRLHSNALATMLSMRYVITDKCDYPEAMLRWIDYFYGEDGATLFRVGIEGKTYKRTADGSIVWTDFITNNPDGLSKNDAIGRMSSWVGSGSPYAPRYSTLEQESVEIFKEIEDSIGPYWPEESWSPFILSFEEQQNANAYESDIGSYVDEMTVKFIVGDESLDDWQNYVATIDRMGLSSLLAIYQTAYERLP